MELKVTGERKGYLWVADISGYTGYLNESELAHAEGTLTDLLQVLIDKPGPPLIISKLEGDAVFSYAFEGDAVSGQTFVELVEDTYVEFRKTVDLMVLNNSCQCNACANVSSLDLKFVIHHGEFLIQKVGKFEELVGPDVNLIHRLMKNSVVEDTRISAYCLYTDDARRHLGLEDLEGLVSHREIVADFGEVEMWVQDLTPVYERSKAEAKIVLSEDDVICSISVDLPMSPRELWDYLTAPEYRSFLGSSDRQEITDRKGGRTGPGSIYQCYHGKRVLPQIVLEWTPFTRIITEDTWPGPWKATNLSVIDLTETNTGTRLTSTYGKVEAGSATFVFAKLLASKSFAKVITENHERFVDAVSEDWKKRSGPDAQISISMESVIAAARSGLHQSTG